MPVMPLRDTHPKDVQIALPPLKVCKSYPSAPSSFAYLLRPWKSSVSRLLEERISPPSIRAPALSAHLPAMLARIQLPSAPLELPSTACASTCTLWRDAGGSPGGPCSFGRGHTFNHPVEVKG